jgi:D-Tyr-tRNAtyr deacylase
VLQVGKRKFARVTWPPAHDRLLQRRQPGQRGGRRRAVGAIGRGLMVLVCAEKGDTEREADAC